MLTIIAICGWKDGECKMEDKALNSVLESFSMCFKKYAKICVMICDHYCLLTVHKKNYFFEVDLYEGGMICTLTFDKEPDFRKEILFSKEWLFKEERELQFLTQELVQGIL